MAADESRPRELRAFQGAARRGWNRRSRLPRALPDQPREPERRALREIGRIAAEHDGRRLRDRGGGRRLPRRLASGRRFGGRARAGCAGLDEDARALLRDDMASDREHGRDGRHDRALDRRARLDPRGARPARASRHLPRLVPPVRFRLRHRRSKGARSATGRGRREDRPHAPARAARERLEGAAGLEPRQARQHRRGSARPGPRRLPRPPEAAGTARPARGSGEGRPRAGRGRGPQAEGATRPRYEEAAGGRTCAKTRKVGSPTGSSPNSGFTQELSSPRAS